jgi:hypothetical protein
MVTEPGWLDGARGRDEGPPTSVPAPCCCLFLAGRPRAGTAPAGTAARAAALAGPLPARHRPCEVPSGLLALLPAWSPPAGAAPVGAERH